MSEAARFAVIGSPVAHSKSPVMHAAAFRALGLPHVYDKIEATGEELEGYVEALRRGAFAGLNVTVPHKARVLGLVDRADPSASATGAANTLVRVGDEVVAHNTDAPALVEELVRLAGGDPARFAGRSAIVLGAGGAARAAIVALGRLGISHVIVRARRQVDELEGVLDASNVEATLTFERLGATPPSRCDELAAIVQATTIGMHGASPGELAVDAIAWESVPPDCVALDVVYAPPRTPFVERAAASGLAASGGLGMLARQGALALELWLGVTAPREAMLAAITG